MPKNKLAFIKKNNKKVIENNKNKVYNWLCKMKADK
jgi:hypothetical protein